MFNHVRTLLLNSDGNASPGWNFLAEEPVPTDYRSQVWPSYLLQFRRVLFGTEPDRAMLNYRLAQYLPIIHATELRDWLYQLDPRVTYDLARTRLYDDALFKPVATSLETESTIDWIGDPEAPDTTGRMEHSLSIEVADSATIHVTRLSPPQDDRYYEYTMDSGLSTLIPLTSTGYQFRVTGNVGDRWIAHVFNRPTAELSTLLYSVGRLNESNFTQLWGTEKAEPWPTFRQLYEHHDEFTYRLGAILMAMAYRADQLRSG